MSNLKVVLILMLLLLMMASVMHWSGSKVRNVHATEKMCCCCWRL